MGLWRRATEQPVPQIQVPSARGKRLVRSAGPCRAFPDWRQAEELAIKVGLLNLDRRYFGRLRHSMAET